MQTTVHHKSSSSITQQAAVIEYTAMPPYMPIFVNEAAAKHLGYEPGEVIGNSGFLTSAVYLEDLPQFLSGMFHLFLRGSHVYEYRFVRKDGSIQPMLVELKLQRTAAGVPQKITSFFAEMPLFSNTAFAAGSESTVLKATIDNAYRIRSVGSLVKSTLAYLPEDVTGKSILEYIPPDYLIAANKVFTRLIECCQDIIIFWVAVKHRSGTLRFFACECRGGFDAVKNRLISAQCCDITASIDAACAAFSAQTRTRLIESHTGSMDTEADPFSFLTAREQEILYLTVEGLSSAQIGAKLAISPRTVETHRANLMKKLRVQSVSQLIRYAVCRIAYSAKN